MEEKVLFYAGEFGFSFSNFSSFNIEWRGKTWMTSEHAYQASKFDDETIIDEIHSAKSAYEALKLANDKYTDKIKSSWNDDEKISVMYDIIKHKHEQHPYVQKQLKESLGREIIENSPKDSFWGRGPDWKGRNELGKCWMKLRKGVYGE